VAVCTLLIILSSLRLTIGYIPGTQILATHDSIYGPGGQSVFKDIDAWVLDYRAYYSSPSSPLSCADAALPHSGHSLIARADYYTSDGSKLGINLLDFSSGWPVVS
jgi:arabinan endo-1,5-alpha-L-arabinosidase